MTGVLLQQTAGGTLSPGIIVALVLVVFTSSLALVVTLGLARRIRAIGDAGEASGERRTPEEDGDD